MGACLERLRRNPPPPPPPSGGETSAFDNLGMDILTPKPTPGPIRVKALFDYAAQSPGDLSFAAGDILILEREEPDGWWWCRHTASGSASGYVPSNFVQRLDLGPESLPCWFEVDRPEAMRNLLMPGYQPGTYLLRPCHQQKEVARYTLSVRTEVLDRVSGENRASVSHYMIRLLDAGGFYITPNNKFDDMEGLLKFYSEPNKGFAVPLDQPCPKNWVPPASFRDFEVDRSRIHLQDRLGSGSFGEVFKAELGRGQFVAVKTMTEGAMRREEFLSEGRTMHKLHHPKIVQLLGVVTKGDPIYIITEFMPHGDLKKYLLKNREQGNVTFDVMITMLCQIAEGMEYLEQMGFIHRDVRAANMLVGDSNIVKVADFGLSKFLEEDVYNVAVENKFPIRWTAPEAATPPNDFSIKSDVWSFGIVIYEVVTKGGNPYSNLQNREVIDKVTKEKYRMPNPRTLGNVQDEDQMYSVMLECWNAESANRPTFSRLKDIFQDYKSEFERQYGAQ